MRDPVFTLVLLAETDPDRRVVRNVPCAWFADRCGVLRDVSEDEEVPLPVVTRTQMDLVLAYLENTCGCAPNSFQAHKPVRGRSVAENLKPLEFARAAKSWSVADALLLVSAAKYLVIPDLFDSAVVSIACLRFGVCAANSCGSPQLQTCKDVLCNVLLQEPRGRRGGGARKAQ